MIESSTPNKRLRAIIILGGGRRIGKLDAPSQYQHQDMSVASTE
jgi:hypothetical protein